MNIPQNLIEEMIRGGITDPNEQAIFLAQVDHESGGFQYLEEIASGAAYEGRSDLGNTQSGDGTRFKGRGYIQLTGRSNYQTYGDILGIDLVNNPQLAATPENAAKLAVAYWNNRVKGSGAHTNIESASVAVNGGYNGYQDRVNKYNAYRSMDLGSIFNNSNNQPGAGSSNDFRFYEVPGVQPLPETGGSSILDNFNPLGLSGIFNNLFGVTSRTTQFDPSRGDTVTRELLPGDLNAPTQFELAGEPIRRSRQPSGLAESGVTTLPGGPTEPTPSQPSAFSRILDSAAQRALGIVNTIDNDPIQPGERADGSRIGENTTTGPFTGGTSTQQRNSNDAPGQVFYGPDGVGSDGSRRNADGTITPAPGGSYGSRPEGSFDLLSRPGDVYTEWRGPYDPNDPAQQGGMILLRDASGRILDAAAQKALGIVNDGSTTSADVKPGDFPGTDTGVNPNDAPGQVFYGPDGVGSDGSIRNPDGTISQPVGETPEDRLIQTDLSGFQLDTGLTYDEVFNRLNSATASQQQAIRNAIAGQADATRAAISGLEVQADERLRAEENRAAAVNLSYSGLPVQERLRYIGGEFLPGLAAIQQDGLNNVADLEGRIADIGVNNVQSATSADIQGRTINANFQSDLARLQAGADLDTNQLILGDALSRERLTLEQEQFLSQQAAKEAAAIREENRQTKLLEKNAELQDENSNAFEIEGSNLLKLNSLVGTVNNVDEARNLIAQYVGTTTDITRYVQNWEKSGGKNFLTASKSPAILGDSSVEDGDKRVLVFNNSDGSVEGFELDAKDFQKLSPAAASDILLLMRWNIDRKKFGEGDSFNEDPTNEGSITTAKKALLDEYGFSERGLDVLLDLAFKHYQRGE